MASNSAGERIDHYQDLASAKVVDKVERWRAEVEEFNLVAEFVLRPPLGDGLRTKAVILEEFLFLPGRV